MERRIKSSGGRPTDPDWTMTRVVRFHPARWQELEDLAAVLSQEGRSVSPSQLAAMLIERGLADLSLLAPTPTEAGAENAQASRGLAADASPMIGDEYYPGLRAIAACLDVEG
jgi:hypothetical protein